MLGHRKFLGLALAGAVVIVAGVCSALPPWSPGSASAGGGGQIIRVADKTASLQFSTSTVGGNPHQNGSGWAKIINERSTRVRATVAASAGGPENMSLVAHKQASIGWAVATEVGEAVRGVLPAGNDPVYRSLRPVFSYFFGGLHWVVPAESRVRGPLDFKNSNLKVSIGQPGSSSNAFNRRLLLSYGINLERDIKMLELSPPNGIQRFKDGAIDAYMGFASLPLGQILEMATARKVRFIAHTGDGAKEFLAKIPGWKLGILPRTLYPNVENAEDIPIVTTYQVAMAHRDLDEGVVYEITRLLFENIGEFHKSYQLAKNVTLDDALTGITTPLHGGAYRYYREKGVKVPEHLMPR
ncbi:MAG: TAXI family TRAP transporter solute-binding subunit [Candidatus Rokubacteria bacterium]|nr:TAXI family TRAP transporter solute-binding subunit [Candidatus Rokubacteria bacterium]